MANSVLSEYFRPLTLSVEISYSHGDDADDVSVNFTGWFLNGKCRVLLMPLCVEC